MIERGLKMMGAAVAAATKLADKAARAGAEFFTGRDYLPMPTTACVSSLSSRA